MSGRNAALRRAAPFFAVPVLVLAAAVALYAVTPRASTAHAEAPSAPPSPAQVPPPVEAMGLEVIGHSDLNQARNNTSDVWYLNHTAYLGYRCGEDKGSSFVDVTDPTKPAVVFQTDPMSRTFANDVKALHMSTASFTGDLLAEPHDRCGSGPPAEVRLWDVTDPAAPELLSSLTTGDGVHNSYVFQRGANAYLLLAAPYADVSDNTQAGYEDVDLDADFAIVDITNPALPSIVGKWNIHDVLGDLPGSVFLHDIWANKAGTLAYGAYWDAGMVLLDITDVRNPVMISRLNYYGPPGVEGNTHAAVPTKNEDFVVITDEDFDPTDAKFEVLSPAAIAGEKTAAAGSFSDMLMGQPMVEGDLVWVGRGCIVDPAYPGIIVDDPYLADPTGKIAVIVRGDCSFADKILGAQRKGAIAAVIVNNNPGGSPPPMGGGDPAITIPGTGIAYEDGNAITTTLGSGVGVRARFGIAAGEWGFTRIADYTDPAAPRLVSEYTIPQTRQYPPADGNYSVHNPWVVGDTLYLSHYWAGVRLVDISDPYNPREKAYLVPAGVDLPTGGTAHSSIWGVITDENGIIYASDITSGLWVMREATGPQPTTEPTTAPTAGPTTAPTSAPTSFPTVGPSPTRTVAPTNVPPNTPVPTSTVAPPGSNVCPQIVDKVPAAAIQAALANPSAVRGYQMPNDPSKPVGPFNPLRTWLSLMTYSKPYHPMFNGLEYKAGCP